jgi:hypothetical protein
VRRALFDASDAEEKATRIGGAAMIDCLCNGKADKHAIHLAALQRVLALTRGSYAKIFGMRTRPLNSAPVDDSDDDATMH